MASGARYLQAAVIRFISRRLSGRAWWGKRGVTSEGRPQGRQAWRGWVGWGDNVFTEALVKIETRAEVDAKGRVDATGKIEETELFEKLDLFKNAWPIRNDAGGLRER